MWWPPMTCLLLGEAREDPRRGVEPQRLLDELLGVGEAARGPRRSACGRRGPWRPRRAAADRSRGSDRARTRATSSRWPSFPCPPTNIVTSSSRSWRSSIPSPVSSSRARRRSREQIVAVGVAGTTGAHEAEHRLVDGGDRRPIAPFTWQRYLLGEKVKKHPEVHPLRARPGARPPRRSVSERSMPWPSIVSRISRWVIAFISRVMSTTVRAARHEAGHLAIDDVHHQVGERGEVPGIEERLHHAALAQPERPFARHAGRCRGAVSRPSTCRPCQRSASRPEGRAGRDRGASRGRR